MTGTVRTTVELSSRDMLLSSATTIGRWLLDDGTRLKDGSLTWGRGFGRDGTPTLDAGMYNGRCGEALFFGALYAATSDSVFQGACYDALVGLRRSAARRRDALRLVDRIGIGLAGVGSAVYALVRVAKWIRDDDLIDDAASLARALVMPRSEQEEANDVVSGLAGAVLGLLTFERVSPSEEIRAGILRLATQLLARRVVDPGSGRRAWPSGGAVPHVGFAHGSTGIAHALMQTFRAFSEKEHYAGAVEAFRFETTRYRDDVRGWPDYAEQPAKRVMCAWCHGAVGVGLSRLWADDLSQDIDDQELIEQDLKRAIWGVLHTPRSGPDNLCCGSIGRMDFLAETGHRLNLAECAATARRQAAGLMRHLQVHDYRALTPARPAFGPGLWQGYAGIGYVLLRLVDRTDFPSILALD